MRQVVFNEFFIISACHKNCNAYDNQVRTRELHNALLDLNEDFQAVVGSYKGQKEVSFLVLKKDDSTEENIKQFLKLYDQETYLYSRQDREGFLIDKNGNSEPVGTFLRLSQDELSNYDNYTIKSNGDNTHTFFTYKVRS